MMSRQLSVRYAGGIQPRDTSRSLKVISTRVDLKTGFIFYQAGNPALHGVEECGT